MIIGALLVALATSTSCVLRTPTLACESDEDCATGFACSRDKGACVLIAVHNDDDVPLGEGEGEGEGVIAEGEGEGEGEAPAFRFTRFEREPATATVVAHEPLVVHWRVSDNDATCVLVAPDGSERGEGPAGSATFRPALDGAISVRCTNADGAELSDTTSFDVVLPADIDASWHAPFVATHPWRVDVTFTSPTARRAFPIDVPIDLAGALRAAGVPVDEVPSPDSVRAVLAGTGAPLAPYYSEETGLLFVRLPALAANTPVVVQVYFAPSPFADGAPWSSAPYENDHVGPSAPVTLNRDAEGAVALLDVNGFDASPFDVQDVLFERGARLVVGAGSCTTPVHADDVAPPFPSLASGPTLRVNDADMAIIEQRVVGTGGVDVVEVLTIAKDEPPALRFTTVLVNTTGAALSDVRYSTLLDLDVPGVLDASETSNTARAIGAGAAAVPAVCDSSETLCGALAGEDASGFRVGTFPGSSNDFVADRFVGLTDEGVLADQRLAVTWLVSSLDGVRVLHSALAVNETFNDALAAEEAAANARALANMPSVSYSPTWIRD